MLKVKSYVAPKVKKIYTLKEWSIIDPVSVECNFPVYPFGDITSITNDAEWENVPFVDNEFGGSKPRFLSKQFKVYNKGGSSICVLMVDGSVPKPNILAKEILKKYPKLVIIYGDIQDRNFTPDMRLLRMSWDIKSIVPYYFFYSFTDNLSFFGRNENTKEYLRDGIITSKRNTSGTIPASNGLPSFKLFDLIGGFNCSLDKAFEMVGMNESHYTKNLPPDWAKDKCPKGTSTVELRNYAMSNYKLFMMDEPDNAALYSLGDIDLVTLWSKRVTQLNGLIKESLGFYPNLDTATCPRSSGALVSLTFNKWITQTYPALAVAANVLCIPSRDGVQAYSTFRDELASWDSSQFTNESKFTYTVAKELGTGCKPKARVIDTEHPERNFKVKDAPVDSIAGISGASIRAFGERTNTSACFNGVVQGGRCVNERPEVITWRAVFDIDLNSCYGSALKEFTYCVGLPTVWSSARDTKGVTLGAWLAKYEHELLDNLYQIMVETNDCEPLTFNQDLIYSKLGVTRDSIRRNLDVAEQDAPDDFDEPWVREVEAAHIKGDFALLTNEIKLGVITSDVLKIIRKVATDNERKELMNLTVVTAAYYPASERVSPDELVKELCDRPGEMTTQDGELVDARTRKWSGLPMTEFIGKFVSTRKAIKRQKRAKGDEFDLKQEALKLFINTTYGCFASPYFAMGNAIMANNITAKARTGVWMLAKALGSAQSITDGGLYSNHLVRFLDLSKSNKDKPGLGVLSNPTNLDKHRNIKVGCLTDHTKFMSMWRELVNLKDPMENANNTAIDNEIKVMAENLDALGTAHINKFWSAYGLELPFQVEHKYANTCERAVTFGTSDYLLVNPLERDTVTYNKLNYVIKSRGAKEVNHPKKLFLLFLAGLATKEEYIKVARNFLYEQRVGVNEWKASEKPGNRYADIFPHDTLIRSTNHTPNLNHSPTRTVKEFQERSRRYGRAIAEFNKKTVDELFDDLFGLGQFATTNPIQTTQTHIKKQVTVLRVKLVTSK